MKQLLLLLLLGLAACQPAAEPATTTSAAAPTASPAPKPTSAATPAAQTAVRFLAWYQQHYEQVNHIYFLDNLDGRDTTKFYAVNPAATEHYLAALQKSNCLSDACLGRWRRYIRQWGDSLRAHPQNDGPPDGFSFDLVLHSQEPEIYWNGIGKAPLTIAYPGASCALVTADFSSSPDMPDQRLFYLRQYPAGWRIDSIDVGH